MGVSLGFVAVFAGVLALFCWIGHARMRAGGPVQAAAMLLGVLLAAGLCYLIGANQPPGFLAGFLGFAMATLAVGAAIAAARGLRGRKGGGGADIVVFAAVLVLAVILSLSESGSSGGGHY